jgi:hypothetical protein
MALLCEFTDLTLSVNPNIVEQEDAQALQDFAGFALRGLRATFGPIPRL